LDAFFLFATIAYLVVDAYWSGARGAVLRLLVVVAVPMLYLPIKRKISKKVAVPLAIFAMGTVLVLPYIRAHTTLNASGDELHAAIAVLRSGKVLEGSASGRGNELVVAAATVISAARTNTFGYGLPWLGPLINFVPRRFWPEKHNLAIFVNYPKMIRNGVGWQLAPGAAFTGLAGTYVEFWWFAPLAWGVFGWWGGRLEERAVTAPDWINAGYLSAYLIGLIYFVTQGFGAAFTGWFYFFIAIWAVNRTTRLKTVSRPYPQGRPNPATRRRRSAGEE